MVDEIEEYLVSKLNDAFKEVEDADQHGTAKSAVKQLKSSFLPSTSVSVASNVPKLSREKLYNLNNLLTEWQMLSKQRTRFPFRSEYLDLKFKRNLDKIKGELQERDEHGTPVYVQTNQTNSAGSEAEAFRWSNRSVDQTKVHGLDDKVMSLQRLLVPCENDDNARFKAIGIVGMRGIGKTTLCQLIFNNEKVKTHFLPRIWVCLSKQPGDDTDYRKETVKRILTCLGVEEEIINSANERHDLKGLLFALRLQLMGKRYLIVLDDVWSIEDRYKNFCSSLADDEKCSERLAYGLPKGFGGTVIVTSRAEEVAKAMVGEENLQRLVQLLDQDSCWKIFKDSVNRDGEQFSGELETLKDKITEKCAGLPLAAKMMGEIAHQELLSKKQKRVVHENPQEQSHQELEQFKS